MHVPIQLVMIVDPQAWADASGCDPEQAIGNIGRYLEAEVLELELVREAGAQIIVQTRDVRAPVNKAEPGAGVGQ